MANKEISEQIKKVCFTGHRELPYDSISSISNVLKHLLRIMITNGTEEFYTGGALGFDTLAALTVLDLKAEFPHVRLKLILPCKNQTKLWNEHDRSLYLVILEKADSYEFLHETYTSTCMHDRNRRLVDSADICVSYLVHSGGGTAYTAAYALKQGRELINIAELI